MPARTHGTLTKWNDDRGFGFITPASGSTEIFVHVSAFPRDGVRPRIGEIVSYELESGDNGKMRAARVMRPGSQRASRLSRRHDTARPRNGLIATAVSVTAIAAIGVIGYRTYIGQSTGAGLTALPHSASSVPGKPAPSQHFQCDGRTYCSQMNSYEEAKFFIQHCPNTQMDGDGDGNPCESQFGR